MTEIDQKKIRAVHNYFEDEFPECNIRAGYDRNRMAPKFQVFGMAENFCTIINRAFFHNRKTEEINAWRHTFELTKKPADHANRKIYFLAGILLMSIVLGMIMVNVSALAGEKQIEKSTKTVVIGTELDYPPYSFHDENDEPTGHNVDLTQAIARVRHKEIHDKWLGVLKPRGVPLSTVFKYIALAVVPLLLLLAVFVIWSSTLKRQVTRRTKDLRESEENLRTTLNSIGDAVIATDTQGIITRMNPVAGKLTGWSMEDAQGKPLTDVFNIINARTKEKEANAVAKVLENGTIVGLGNHTMLIAKDGSQYQIADSGAPIRDAGGNITGVVLVFRDVTKEYVMQEAMRERVKELTGIYNLSHLIEEKDDLPEILQGAVDLIPDSWQYPDITCARLVIEGKSYTTQNYEDTAWSLSRDLVVAKRTIGTLDVGYLKERPQADEGPFLKEEGNLITAIAERLQHVIERKKLETQLQQSHKMEAIGTLAGGIAHDFNNILSPIMIHSEMVMLELPSGSPLQQNVKQIFKAGERARDLIKQILIFARKQEKERIPIKISQILKEALKLLRYSLPSTIEIEQNIEVKSDTVLADPTQINQIVMNLATNAAHAMRAKGGVLEVSLVNENIDSANLDQFPDLNPGSYQKLTVSDTGHGITPEVMDRIFEPYYTTKAVGEGTGMGLALVHGIVKSHGGNIMVESEPGKGTAFHILLPLIESEVSPVTGRETYLPRGNEHLLFVDDEKAVVDAIQPMLEILGYKVTARTSSIEALEAFRSNPNAFDLVVTDMTMPNMTGKALAKELMSIRSDIPIILCTGFSEQIDERRAKVMGISAFVMKPTVMSQMANTIRQVLDPALSKG